MSGLAGPIRSGGFLTRGRLVFVPCALLVGFALALAFLALSAHGIHDYTGKRPLGTDYSDIYAAGNYVLDRKPAAPFAALRQYREEQRLFGAKTDFYGWHYPPYFLLLAAPLAALPYLLSLLVWQGMSFAFYLASIARLMRRFPQMTRRQWLVPAIAFPAVFINLTHGQNGFLTAGLMGFALAFLDERPLLSGLCFGLMVYKPQFGLTIPLVLAATGRWRVFASATATVAALTVGVIAIFGTGVWSAFLASTHFTRTVVLEQGAAGFFKIDSVFAWVRMWNGPVWLAYLVQGAVTVVAAAAVVRLWRSKAGFGARAMGLCLAAILTTPYSFDYDMMVLAPGIALMAGECCETGFPPYARSLLAALWIVPLLARPAAMTTLMPVGILTISAMFVLLARTSRPRLVTVAGRSR
ncbi:MAG: glycosyltransferase family 87 protein [Acetobacteraceae bacterium]